VTFPSVAGPDLSTAVPLVVAQQPSPKPEDPGGRGEDFGKSSPLGFLVLVLFFIAVAFLIRSMNKHLRRVPASFDKPENGEEPPKPPENGSPPSKPEPA
jgi:hypothetical protein